jgi:beta-glucanase (GH16 family)
LAIIAGAAGLVIAWPLGMAPGAAPDARHQWTRPAAQPAMQSHSRRPRGLIWDDEFNGPAGAPPNARKWQVIRGGGGFGNDELQYYTGRSSNIALDGAGHLVITALRQRYTGSDGVTRNYTAAAIQTKGRFQVMYGRLEARIEIPQGQGLWPAFWAVGSDVDSVGWPSSGEIDMMENTGNDPFTISGSIHGPQPGLSNGYGITTRKHSSRSLARGFHVYGVTWSYDKLVFTLDGVPYATYTPSTLARGQQWEFNKPFFLIVNLAVGGTIPGSPDAATPFPAKMLVDWLRVYR